MTSSLRIRCIQWESREGEPWQEALSRLEGLLPGKGEADLVILPELWYPGYFFFDRYRQAAEHAPGMLQRLSSLCRERGFHLHAGSLPFVEGDQLYNLSVLLRPDGSEAVRYAKMHLFGYGSRETELLTPGWGPAYIDLPFGKVGLSTCYDLRFPELYSRYLHEGVVLLLVTAAWPAERLFALDLFSRARAHENGMFLVLCNAGGVQDGVTLAGGSRVLGPDGQVRGELGQEAGLLDVTLDLGEVDRFREAFPAVLDRRRRWSPPDWRKMT